ncbi:MAG: CBS domain-containing protein [Rhizobiales bacterium]|nr:CBS domain-containing protein [Hyphomicrobiales bacterium]
MNVQSILTAKGNGVVTSHASMTLEEVARELTANRVGSVVVVDRNGAIVGILSERDVVRAVAARGAAALEDLVGDVMTREVVTCRRDEAIESLMEKMTRGRFRHLPVVDAEKLVGIISIGDVVKHRLAEVDMEAQAMRAYIAAN